MSLKLIFIFILAFFIRLIALNQSLWLDEATTALVVLKYSYLSIIKDFSPFDFHPPFYYLLLKFWTNIFGYSEIALRMPSVIASLVTGFFVYKIAKLLNGSKTGFWASLFFLFNPLIIYYSQEARMYMIVTMFLTASTYFFLKLLIKKKLKEDEKNLAVLFFGVFNFLALITFYGSFFLIISFIFYFLLKKHYRYFLISIIVLFLFSILIIPLLYSQLVNAKIALTNVSSWSLVLGKANLKNLLLIPVKFSIGRIDFHPKWFYYLISGLWTLYVFYCLGINLKTNNSLKIKNYKLIILYLMIFPIVFGFLVSFFTPLLSYFRFLYLIPIMAVLLSFTDNLNRKILIVGFLFFSILYLINPQFHREDWRSLGKSLKVNQPVYMILTSSDPLFYYRRDLKIYDLKKINDYHLPKKIYVIPYTAQIHGVSYEKFLLSKNYSLIKRQSFHRLYLEEWEKLK